MNGGSVLAMTGKNCVALAVDKRFGSGSALVNVLPRQVLLTAPRVLVAFTGLEGDIQTLHEELVAQVTTKYTRGAGFGAKRSITPRAMTFLTSHVLYARKQRAPYYVEPMVVGLEEDDDEHSEDSFHPFLCSMDMIGARSFSSTFCCSGAAEQSLYGTAEAMWRPDLSPDDLVEVCGKAFLSALERDCLSGYGAVVYLVTADGVTAFDLASRND